jgi:hypothetical protein
MTYKRVLPRDLFNEAKLLKCIGKITLLIEDGLLSDFQYHYDGEAFNIIQDESDGSISVANISFWYKGHDRSVILKTGLNDKANWPLIMVLGDEEYYLFQENGDLMPLGA